MKPTMKQTLYTSKGAPIEIGREIGKGGEGSVFDVPGLSDQVAKLYHKPLDSKKQAKLSYMVSTADTQLLNYVAWPQDTLHPSRGGPVAGFLMPKITGKDPIHMLYSPAHRRQEYPKAAWDFLLFVARNIAASFEVIHSHGHVIGDVNQNSFLVGRDSKVVLIDSDSFQVNARGTMHLCEVGVSHFTPPELQSLSSFDGFTRTTNHDNFGLALLLFHVLMGGRHPYSGVPLRNGVGDALEADIKNFRYAYARDNQSRGFSPPPRSIPISALPNSVESMFHLAFTENGASRARPTAQQWVGVLDGMRTHLRKCNATAMHVYPDHVSVCPWCELEKQGVIYFLDIGATLTTTNSGFVLSRVWALIEKIPPPPPLTIPDPAKQKATPKTLPRGVPGNQTILLVRVTIVVAAIAGIWVTPRVAEFFISVGLFGFLMAPKLGREKREKERNARRDSLKAAQWEYDRLAAQLKECGPEGFAAKKRAAATLCSEYENLPKAEKAELDKLLSTAQQRQLQVFLDRFFIDSAEISGVGPGRKAALRSFGIETAADINRNRVMQIKGFGEHLTSSLLDWRKSCERRFVFNPNQAVSQTDRAQVHSKFAARKASLENQITKAAEDLGRFSQSVAVRASQLLPQVEVAAHALAQAQADLSYF